MAKLLKEGKLPVDTPWWVGLRGTCPKCTAEWQLEESDRANPQLKTEIERSPNGQRKVFLPCGTANCGGVVVYDSRASINASREQFATKPPAPEQTGSA